MASRMYDRPPHHPQVYPPYHYGMHNRQPLASKPVFGVNSNIPPPSEGWKKHQGTQMHPVPGNYYYNHNHQQMIHASTPQTTYPKPHPNGGRMSMPFKSPTTLNFERMLTAGKFFCIVCFNVISILQSANLLASFSAL